MYVATRLHALRSAFVNDLQTAICMPPAFIAKLACKASIGSLQNTHNTHLARHKTDRLSYAKTTKRALQRVHHENDPQNGMCFGPRRHIHLGSSTFPSVNICYAKYRDLSSDMLSKYLANKDTHPGDRTRDLHSAKPLV